MKVSVILASTRDGRLGERIAKWVADKAAQQTDWDVEILDIKEFNIPFFHDAILPSNMNREYPDANVVEWSKKIDAADAFIFVTPEYNHGLAAPLKNAIDWLYPEWSDKAAAIVSYSGSNDAGIRAGEQLRQTLTHVGVANVQTSTRIAFAGNNVSDNGEVQDESLNAVLGKTLGQLDQWGKALNSVRTQE